MEIGNRMGPLRRVSALVRTETTLSRVYGCWLAVMTATKESNSVGRPFKMVAMCSSLETRLPHAARVSYGVCTASASFWWWRAWRITGGDSPRWRRLCLPRQDEGEHEGRRWTEAKKRGQSSTEGSVYMRGYEFVHQRQGLKTLVEEEWYCQENPPSHDCEGLKELVASIEGSWSHRGGC
ncbi:hypothetical protein GOBAR_DD23393 [Gossypium barbadense]|nr:hypothetical protein GOBAR_DD23393 [Gossypium barbadense]